MVTVALTTTPTQIDDGTSYTVLVTNTGAVTVDLSRGGRLRPGQTATVYPEGTALTAAATSGTGTVTTAATAAPQTQAQQIAATIAGLPGTYAGISTAQAARRAGGSFGGMVVVADRNNGLKPGSQSNGTDTQGQYRYAHTVRYATTEMRLVYTNYYGAAGAGIADNPYSITVKASMEAPVSAYQSAMSSTYPVTFNGGSRTVVIPAGGLAVSDPVPLVALAGKIVYSNTRVTVASGDKWPLGLKTNVTGAYANVNYFEGGVTGTAVTDTTDSGTPPTGFVFGYGPAAVIGTPAPWVTLPTRSVFALGDSILNGDHDATYAEGFIQRAATAASVPLVNTAHPGEQASQIQGPLNRWRLPLAQTAQVAVVNYGRNDLANIASITLATFQGYVIPLWLQLAAQGCRVYHTTLTPVVTSSDGFSTTSGQTVSNVNNYNTNRIAFNAWLRDGAPLTATTLAPAATGATGVGIVRAGAANFAHPLAGFIEVADVVETGRDSGIWKTGRTVTDAVITSGSKVVTSATAAFTSADLGKSIYLSGAGAAGAALNAITIATVTSATSITYEGGASSSQTASGQTLCVGNGTDDGTHPTATLHVALAASFDLTAL